MLVTNAFDGRSGQGGFYHVLKSLTNIFVRFDWWDGNCEPLL